VKQIKVTFDNHGEQYDTRMTLSLY